MSAIQPYLANALFNHMFRGSSYTMPTDTLVALFTGAIEVAGGSYVRQSCHGSGNWTSPINGAGTNVNPVTFPVATTPWGTVDHYGLFDQSGNLLVYDVLLVSKVVGTGDQFIVAAGQLAESFQ